MTTLAARLRRMSGTELSDRVRAAARTHGQRLHAALRRPSWDRAAIRDVVARGVLPPELSAHIDRGEWAQANAALRSGLAARPSRFVLDPHTSTSLRRAVVSRWPDAVADAAERADAILAGRYDLLGYEALSFARNGAEVDWHFDPVHKRCSPRRFWADVRYLDPAIGDHKIIWELNRQQYLLMLSRAWWLTGDPRYRATILTHVRDWMAANPPLVGINWASMLELAFRSMSWLWGLHALLTDDSPAVSADDATAWLVDLLVGLDRQLTHVGQNLSRYFSPNTHLTGEALALYVAGAALPELSRSARWLDVGRGVLLAEIQRQIGADGGHAERSTHYHRYTLDFYLLALLTARRIGDTDADAAFTDAASRAATVMQALVDDRGVMPQIGDDDGGMLWPLAGRDPRDVRDSLGLAAVVLDRPDLSPWGVPEEAFWVGWSARPDVFAEAPVAVLDRAAVASDVRTTVLDDTGFVTIRNEHGDHLVLDAGAHGYLNGGHAHADALAVTLAIDAAPLLIDPGTATYTMDPALRDRMRSTALHNTLTLDGRPSSIVAGPFHWRTRADAHLDVARHNGRFAWAEARHDAYPGARHRRSVVHSIDGDWLIVDEVLGSDAHTAHVHWHFDPAWRVSCAPDGDHLVASDDEGRRAWLLHDGGSLWLTYGDDDPGLGWCSPRYGIQQPTCAARIERGGMTPISMVTWIGSARGEWVPPQLTRLDVDADRDAAAIGLSVVRAGCSTLTLLRSGDAADRETRGATIGEYQTNARLLQYTVARGRPVAMSIADASHALALRDDWISVSADAPMTDLHAELRGERLHLWSSAPPRRMHVQGSLGGPRAMRLNGRELPIDVAVHERSVTIRASDWRTDMPVPADDPVTPAAIEPARA